MHLVYIILVIIIIGYISCKDIISQSYCIVDDHQNTVKDCYNPTNSSLHVCYLNNSHGMSSIPNIKLNDGICDCCDGSDESTVSNIVANGLTQVDGITTICLNTCRHMNYYYYHNDNTTKEVQMNKSEALTWHRIVQGGVRARNELVLSIRNKGKKDNQLLQSLNKDKKEITSLLQYMKMYLLKELPFESEVRLKLLREREIKCANGMEAACQYFYPGFHDEEELLDVGYHRKFLNPRKRFHYEHTPKEKDFLSKHTGLERIKFSICPIPDLLPDDDTRIFIQLGEYMSFQKTVGGEYVQDRMSKIQRENHLFSAVLDDGERGYQLAWLILAEWVGLLVSPAIASLELYEYASQAIGIFLWNQTVQCSQWNNTTISNSTIMSSSSLELLRTICDLIIQTEREDSPVANFLSVFDYTTYNSILDPILAVIDSAMVHPLKFWQVVRRAPRMYYQYYILDYRTVLPARRHCCLLRYGKELAEKELKDIELRIKTKEEQVKQSKRLRLGYRKYNEVDNSIEVFPPVDLGADGSWESIWNTCLKKELTDHIYSFSFFGEITRREVNANSSTITSLGHFKQWGVTAFHIQPVISNQNIREANINNEQISQNQSSQQHQKQQWWLWYKYSREFREVIVSAKIMTKQQIQSMEAFFFQSWMIFYSWYLQCYASILQQLDDVIIMEQFDHAVLHSRKSIQVVAAEWFKYVLLMRPIPKQIEEYVTTTTTSSSNSTTYSSSGNKEWSDNLYYRYQLYDEGSLCHLDFITASVTTATDTTAVTAKDISESEHSNKAQQQSHTITTTTKNNHNNDNNNYNYNNDNNNNNINKNTVRGPILSIERAATIVEFECGTHNAILNITEVLKNCKYHMIVSTPIACTNVLEERSIQYLEKLNIFGFTSSFTKNRN